MTLTTEFSFGFETQNNLIDKTTSALPNKAQVRHSHTSRNSTKSSGCGSCGNK